MTETAIKMLIILPAWLFAGTVLFLSTVFAKASAGLSEKEYHAIFAKIIEHGRKSILINTIVLVPLLMLIVLVVIDGFKDILFISGAIVYVIGSFVLSRVLNEPRYAKLLSTDPNDTKAVSNLREKLNRGNSLRAVISVMGAIMMGVSYLG